MSESQKTPSVSPFALSGSGSGFSSRSGDIFAALDTIEAKHSSFEKVRSRDDSEADASLLKAEPRDATSSSLSGSSSQQEPSKGFKRPLGLPPRNQPRGGARGQQARGRDKKWTYYNLADVSDDSMSDRTNTAAALSFLDSRHEDSPQKKLKADTGQADRPQGANSVEDTGTAQSTHTDHMDVDTTDVVACSKHTFNRPSDESIEDGSGQASFRSRTFGGAGYRLMPEYQIGAKPNQKKSRPSKKGSLKNKTAVSLVHLDDENEEDEEYEAGIWSRRQEPGFSAKQIKDVSELSGEDEDDTAMQDSSKGGHMFQKNKSKIQSRGTRNRQEGSDSDGEQDIKEINNDAIKSPNGSSESGDDLDLEGVD